MITFFLSSGHRAACRRTAGFTLIEMIMVIVLTGIIFAIGGTLLSEAMRAYFRGQDITDADWQGRLAFERMTRELRAIRSVSAADLALPAADRLQFRDAGGNPVCFYLSGGRLMRSADAPGAACTTDPQPLADNVSGLSFTFWDSAGGTIGAPYYIAAALTITTGDYSGNFRSTVRPRSL